MKVGTNLEDDKRRSKLIRDTIGYNHQLVSDIIHEIMSISILFVCYILVHKTCALVSQIEYYFSRLLSRDIF